MSKISKGFHKQRFSTCVSFILCISNFLYTHTLFFLNFTHLKFSQKQTYLVKSDLYGFIQFGWPPFICLWISHCNIFRPESKSGQEIYICTGEILNIKILGQYTWNWNRGELSSAQLLFVEHVLSLVPFLSRIISWPTCCLLGQKYFGVGSSPILVLIHLRLRSWILDEPIS